MTTETLVFPNDRTPLDLLLFRRFGQVAGLLETTLALNKGLAALGPFPPAGTPVVVSVPAPTKAAGRRPRVQLYD